jgi:4-methylaminobutanoate oxidase (formaldehyde-forming)
MALAKGARMQGVRIIEGVTVTGFRMTNGRVVGIETDQGSIGCEQAALCAGIWSRQLGRMAGVNVPIQPAYHCYMITEKVPDLPKNLPFLRDPDLYHYVRDEVGSLLAGQYDPNPIPFEQGSVPNEFEFHLAQENLEHFLPTYLPFLKRVPILENLGVKNWIHGLESFTEDQNPIVGEAPEVKGLFVACGFNAYGISVGTGFGMAMAEWMLNGTPSSDLWPADIRRFSRYHGSDNQVRIRSLEGQGHHYKVHYPFEEMSAGRPLRRSAIYDRLKIAGASFGAKSGWERVNWIATDGADPIDTDTFGRGNWHDHVGREHAACRSAAAIFDQSSFAKFVVTGRDAEAAMQRICAGDVSKPAGRLTYTPLLNDKGGIEADLIVVRLSETEFYVVTGTNLALRDSLHIRRSFRDDEHVSLLDVTSAFGVLSVMGPHSRAILQAVAEGDFDNAAFPFGHAREVFVAGAPVRALRMSFVGELGWELHVPTEYMTTVYDAVKKAGAEHGLRDGGYRAINSLRIEKGYRAWGSDITPDNTPLEAGLGFAVSFRKNVDFVGRSALLHQSERPLARRMASFRLGDPSAILLGGETVYRNGDQVGFITSGAHAYTYQCDIGLGYVERSDGLTDEFVKSGAYEIEVAMKRVPASINLDPWYDPENAKMRS